MAVPNEYGRPNIKGIEAILRAGANPNLHYPDGASALYYVAAGNNTDLLILFLENGADPNIKNKSAFGGTPIFATVHAENKNLAHTKLLLDYGADINYVDAMGFTPLTSAAATNQYDTVYQLLLLGADYRAPSKRGLDLVTLIEKSRLDSNSDAVAWRAKVVEFLKNRGVEIISR